MVCPMELRQVEYVLAVIEHGGFTRAAEALHVAQPTLSHGIRTLEQELGVDLFDRVGRGVRLSAAGRAFAPAARRARQDLAAARDAARDVAGLEAGELSIMALPTLVVDPLVAWVGAMRAAHPGVQVRIVEAEEATAVPTAVRDGLVDLGLAELDDVGPPLVTEVAVDQELLVIAPPGADLGATVTLSRLATPAGGGHPGGDVHAAPAGPCPGGRRRHPDPGRGGRAARGDPAPRTGGRGRVGGPAPHRRAGTSGRRGGGSAPARAASRHRGGPPPRSPGPRRRGLPGPGQPGDPGRLTSSAGLSTRVWTVAWATAAGDHGIGMPPPDRKTASWSS